MKAERWRAGSAAGGTVPNADGNAYSYETTFTETGIGTPLVMRNKVSAQLDENGLLTVNDYVATGEVVTCTSRSSFSSSPLPTYTVTDYDAAYGLVDRRATHLTDGVRMLDEERIASFDTATGLQTESVSSARDGISTQCSCKRTRTERARTRPRRQTIRGLRRNKHTRRT